MLDDVMQGLTRRDFALHSRHFSVSLKSSLGNEEFLESAARRHDAWGVAGERALVCVFRKPRSFTMIWDQAFDRTDGQVLLLATIALKGGRYFVDHFLLH